MLQIADLVTVLIDLVAMREFGMQYDEDGKIAATGQIDQKLFK